MATISNPNDPNRNASGVPSTPAPAPVQVSTANVAPQQASTSGTPTGTGQFSTLQKYLGANQGAGQRLGNAIGGNLSNEATGLANATNTALSNSTDANKKQADLTNNTNSFTTALNAPSTAPTAATPSIGYDVSKYGTNLSGTQAAAEIANNANKTKKTIGGNKL